MKQPKRIIFISATWNMYGRLSDINDQNIFLIKRNPCDCLPVMKMERAAMIHRLIVDRIDHKDIISRQRSLRCIFIDRAMIPFFHREIDIDRPDQELIRPEPVGELPEIAAKRQCHFPALQIKRTCFIPLTIMIVCF